MRRCKHMTRFKALVLTAVMTLSMSFVSQARAVAREVPVTLQMDINSRQTVAYDGYTSYVMAYRASENDTFTVEAKSEDVSLKDITMNYYLMTYNGETQKLLECTVHELEEGRHYPVIRPETAAREREGGELYDTLERCYMIEFRRGDERTEIYFNIFPEDEMAEYRNFLLGSWDKDSMGWRYIYQESYLTSWAKIKNVWYLFGRDGYMLTGWQQFGDKWYYLDPGTGAMQRSCTVDGYQLDESGARVEK